MAFGRKKNKKGQGADTSAVAEVTQSPSGGAKSSTPKKRKPAELLSSVVNESAVGAAIDLLKQNDAFALPNGTAWVGLLLSVDDIGGLSQKQKGDATKGSIIELIAADKIQVVATKVMLEAEFLGIVPTTDTLDRMEEYRLLTEARYYWVVLRSEDAGQTLIADAVQDSHATYAQALSISRGETALSDVLPEVWVWGGGAVESESAVEAPVEAELALVGAVGSSAPTLSPETDHDPLSDAVSFENEPDVDYSALAAESETDDAEPHFDVDAFEAQFETPALVDEDENSALDTSWQDDNLEVDAATGEVVSEGSPAGADEDSTGYFQYLEENRDRVVDEQEVRDTIARRFLSNDLDLVVDLAEFNKTFGTEAAAIAIEVAEDPSDWLGSQVAQLSRQANAELALLHQANTDELREMFVETMALHVEKTMALVSTETPGSQYVDLMAGAKKDFEAQRAAAPQEVAALRKEITTRFEAAATSRADQAAAHARAVYEDKNRPKLERDLAEVGLDLDRRHEEQYAHDRQTVLEMRRKEANTRMDVGTNRIFELLRERQGVQREQERELLERWNRELTRFIDDNRKNDVARADALAEQLARDNQIEQLKAEHAARMEEIKTEHANSQGRLEQELIRHRAEALSQLTARQTEWETTIALEQERTRSSSTLAGQLSEQMNALGASYEAQYKGQIATLEADKASYAEELNRAHAIQKRANNTTILLVVVLTIAALAVGTIVGWSLAANQPVVESAPAGFAVLGSFLTEPSVWLGS